MIHIHNKTESDGEFLKCYAKFLKENKNPRKGLIVNLSKFNNATRKKHNPLSDVLLEIDRFMRPSMKFVVTACTVIFQESHITHKQLTLLTRPQRDR